MRLKIGFLINEIEGFYQGPIWRGVSKAAEQNDCDLIIFEGGMLEAKIAFSRQHNIVYDFINPGIVDGLVLVSGALGIFLSQDELYKYYQRFLPIPMVSLSLSFPGIPGVQIDNRSGLFDLIEHLIVDHNYRNIAFVTGPEGNEEAEIRFLTYQEVLKKHKIAFNPDLVAKGKFIPLSGRQATQYLLERKIKIDAIVYANDEMALAGLEVIKKAGLRVPADIAITGFDDIEAAGGIIPSLSTVKQPLFDQAYLAVELLIARIKGETIPEVTVLPAQRLLRQSCGCFKGEREADFQYHPQISHRKEGLSKEVSEGINLQIEKKKLLDILFDDLKKSDAGSEGKFLTVLFEKLSDSISKGWSLEEWQHLICELSRDCALFELTPKQSNKIHDILQRSQMLIGSMMYIDQSGQKQVLKGRIWTLRNLVYANVTTFDMHELIHVLDNALPGLNINSAYMALYKGGSIINSGGEWELPEEAEVVYSMTDRKRDVIQRRERIFPCRNLLPKGLWPEGKRLNIIVKPLFFQDEHFGFVIFELSYLEELYYEGLRGQISSAVKGSMLLNAREEAGRQLKKVLKELEKHNMHLKVLAQKDELTGLFNRRGLLNMGRAYMEEAEIVKEPFLVFFADMDGLKKINDTYGHKEGDWAIKAQAQILKNSFRDKDIIARLGGDEFIVLAVNSKIENVNVIKKRISKNVESANKESKKPFQLSISIGVVPYLYEKELTFEEILKEADDLLYQEKMKKKNNATIHKR